MNPLDLKQREEQGAGNSDDSLNPGNRHYNEELINQKKTASDGEINDDFDGILAANGVDAPGSKVDAHGDKVRRNYNADDTTDDREALSDAENNPKKPASDPTSGARGGLAGWLAKGGKKYGASGGVLGILGIGMIVISVMLSPAALFATIEKSLTNDGSDSSRTNSAMLRAFRGGTFHGECTGSKLKCKFVSMTKAQLSKWTQNRFKITGTIIDADGKQTSGGEREIKPDDMKDGQRVQMTAAEFPNGVRTTTNSAFEAETKRSIESRKSALGVIHDKAGPFFTQKFSKVMGKFGASKGVIATKDSKPAETEEQKRTFVEGEADKARSKILGNFERTAAASGIVSDGVVTACTVYNIVRIAVGAVKAKWIIDIVTFALPFVQLASKIGDGSATDKDTSEIEGRAQQLVWYPNAQYTQKLASEAPDEEARSMILGKQDLTATDSQGLRMAMYGDNTSLYDYTLAYTTGGIGSVAAASKGISEVQNFLGGKDNVRQICIEANRTGLAAAGAQAAACVIGAITVIGAVICIGKGAAAAAAFIAVAYVATKYGTEALIKAMATADVPSDLRGVDAGNALAAGIGLFLSRTSRGYGLKPASTTSQVKEFISRTDNVYNEDYTEIAKYDAQQNPFDLYNEHSFASTLNVYLNPYISGSKTGFAFLANALSVVKNSLVPSANALHSQPSLMTSNEANLNHRLNVVNGVATCPDTDKQEIGIVCDWSGRMVGYTSNRVLDWADQMANGDMAPFTETIDYLRQEGKFKDVKDRGENDGGTYDETCTNADNIINGVLGNTCDNSKKPSINEDGSVVADSQYDKYKKFCSEDRNLDLGSADDAVESGTERDQKWITGEQCAVDSEMMDRFAFYFNLCETQYSMANDETDCSKEGQSKSTVTQGSGDACSLMNNPNIVYVNEGTKKGLKEICETGKSVNSCGDTNYTLDQELMNVITTLSSKYKVWLNNFGFQYDRNMCGGGEHPKGKAIDLNGIEKLGGGKAGGPDWGGITYGDPKQVAIIQEYASDWLAAIAPNHGGVGQSQCSAQFKPTQPNAINFNGAAFFPDSCDHLHIDVRDRGGASAL